MEVFRKGEVGKEGGKGRGMKKERLDWGEREWRGSQALWVYVCVCEYVYTS